MGESSVIENSEIVEAIYGYWPSFHDAEILSITLQQQRDSNSANAIIRLNYWETKIINEETSRFDYVLDKNMVITLEFRKVTDCCVEEFNHQNVIDELLIEKTVHGIEAEFIAIHGAGVTVSADSVSVVEVEPFIQSC